MPHTREPITALIRLACVATVCTPAVVAAQAAFPERPVRVIVNFATGGPSDIVARLLAARLTETWGKAVVVENIAGGSGNIGVERAVKATPDGYTLLLSGSSPIVLNPSLQDKLPFDPVRDLTPVSLLCTVPNLLVIHPELPAKNVEEFVALAKKQPGKFTFASSGSGTATHLGGELFKARAGIDLRHVPYKGTGAMMPDLVAGRVTMTIAAVATFFPMVRDGRLRALAVASGKRVAALPDLPTVAESGHAGLAGFDTSSWQGLWVPANTPAALVRRVNADVVSRLALPEVRARLTELGMEAVGSTSPELARVIQSELTKWARVIRTAGIKAD